MREPLRRRQTAAQREVVALRELERGDIARLLAWRSSRELYGWLAGDFRPSTLQAETQWFAGYEANRERNVRFAICRASDGKHIGNTYLLDIDRRKQSA